MNLTGLNLVEEKHVRHFGQQRESESVSDTWLWATSDEKLDLRDLSHESSKDGQDCGDRFFVFTFVQSVDHNDHRNRGFHEGPDYQLLHLVIQGLIDDFGVRLDQPDECQSELGVPPGELYGKGGEDQVEVTPILEVSGAKEGGAELSICERPLRDRLCDSALPRPSEPVQPVNGGFVGVADPGFDLVQNFCARPPETTVAVAVSIACLLCVSYIIEDSCFACKRMSLQAIVIGNTEIEDALTWFLQGRRHFVCQMYIRRLTIGLGP